LIGSDLGIDEGQQDFFMVSRQYETRKCLLVPFDVIDAIDIEEACLGLVLD
jgi:hypothetical protein